MKSQKAYYAAWYAENKEKRAASRAAWAAANQDKIKAAQERNKEQAAARRRARYAENPEHEKTAARQREYAKRNPDKVREITARYKAKLKQATPQWLSALHRAEIRKMRAEAALLGAQTGVPMGIDHIVPIQHEAVCGLHVPWNICIMARSANSSKGNRTWPDMWEAV